MSNVEILSSVLVDWAKPMIDDVAGQVIAHNESVQRANAWIKKYFPVSENYSIWNDMAFLALPLLNIGVLPLLSTGIARLGLSDEALPMYAREVVEAMLGEAQSKGKVQFLERYSFTADDISRLRDLIAARLPRNE